MVNRSQADIIAKHTMKSAHTAETKFFQERTEYREVANRCGIYNLAHTISKLLTAHIQARPHL